MPEEAKIPDSVLESIKALAGLTPEYTPFDIELMIYINGVFATLHQLGVGGERPFMITGSKETWTEFLQGAQGFEFVKPYMGMKVKLQFDPPQSGFGVENIRKTVDEYEWRLYMAAEEAKRVRNQS